MCTMNAGEQKQNSAPTAEDEMEYHQQRNDISELKEKTESAYCHVTQIQINERPRLQKLPSMFQINDILKTANEAMASSSSCIFHGVGLLVDLLQSHISRSLFKGLP